MAEGEQTMSGENGLEEACGRIRADPFDPQPYLDRGILWFESGHYNEAVSDLLYYESLGGTDVRYARFLGLALSKATCPGAEVYLGRYADANPGDSEAILSLADSCFERGDYERASACYRRAVEEGADPSILTQKAQYLAGMGLREEAAMFDPSVKKRGLFRRRCHGVA